MTQHSIDGLSSIPDIGLGTWKAKKGEVVTAVSAALDIGYRHFDCASIYNNENEIGAALSKGIFHEKVRREQLWVSSKLWNNAHAAKHVRPALERSLKNLKLDYLDLYLIHWPVAFRADITFPKRPDQFISLEELPIIETWKAMEKMVKKGLCRHIGVSNFSVTRLKELQAQASIKPFVNQIELHPFLQQPKMVEHCKKTGIKLTGYSPLGSAHGQDDPKYNLFTEPTILGLATKHLATPAQILLAWSLQRGTTVIPKSIHPTRLKENFEARALYLDKADMEAISQLDQGYRFLDGAFFAPHGSPYSVNDLWQDDADGCN